ncbi:MAG TPA: RNA polymerase sigma factor [Oscillospiraceae bacterium]|nr:RNA polymerase sigma factor [Oscillospiraceae bacterium]
MRDKQLLIGARLGDKAALSEVVERYYNDIYKFLVRRTGSPFIAEEVTQNTFLKFISTLENYKEKNKLRGYLFTIAINCSNDYFRSERKAVSLNSFEDCKANTDVEGEIEEISHRERVKKALGTLPEWQRDVVILRYYHDMKLKEIAKVLDIPVSTAKTRLHRASKVLKEKLEGETENEVS